jgi:hypothetical protein
VGGRISLAGVQGNEKPDENPVVLHFSARCGVANSDAPFTLNLASQQRSLAFYR